MTDSSKVKITIAFIDQKLDSDRKDQEVNRLLPQLKQLVKDLDEKTPPSKVIDPNPPEDNKAGGGFLPGWLTAEVKLENVQKVANFLRDRLAKKAVKVGVKYTKDSEEYNIEASTIEDFERIWSQIQNKKS